VDIPNPEGFEQRDCQPFDRLGSGAFVGRAAVTRYNGDALLKEFCMRLSGWLVVCAVGMVVGVPRAVAAEPGIIETVAGTGGESDGGSTGPALSTNVGQPFGVEFGPDGGLYITEVANHRVRRLDLEKRILTTVAGTGHKGYAGDGGPAAAARLNEPYEVRFDAAKNMYFVEMQNHVVRKVDAATGVISTIAGTSQAGYGGDGGPATKALLRVPHSIALDGRGGLYIADIGNHRIRRVDLKTGVITTIAGTGERRLPSNGARAAGQPILGPRALYIDRGTMWIALREGNSIWRLDLETGRIHHVAGSGEKGFGGDGGNAGNARFNGPKGIVVGPSGLFVVDTENQTIRRIDLKDGKITTVAGNAQKKAGFGGDGGPATAAILNRPHGICLGPDGAIYIGDTLNHRVRRVRFGK
jgi:sugar lactone lactonase YvrE